jgi:hypothetical protein
MPEEAGAESGEGQDMGPIRELADRVRGELLSPGHEDYDRTRRVFNFMIDRRPAPILRCAGVADVMQGVLFARTQQSPLSIHSGGHGAAGAPALAAPAAGHTPAGHAPGRREPPARQVLTKGRGLLRFEHPS